MGHIVVGVDGSDGAERALQWAAAEAKLRDQRVVALLSWGYLDQIHVDPPGFDPSYTEEDARVALATFVERAVGIDPGVTIEERVVCDLPVRALLDATEDADLLVVGARGLGGFRGLLVGSVSQECLHHSPIPVAVVRSVDQPATSSHPRVVVGIDGSPTSRLALAWAIDEAVARRADLEVVHSWRILYPGGYPYDGEFDPTPVEEAAEALVERMLDAAPTANLANPPIRTVCMGGPRDVLLDVSKGAEVLVVGAKGVGGFRGMLLGSVSHAVAQHAECATVIIPPVREEP
jgi:nucleotide-binding universal stress UspA family protein